MKKPKRAVTATISFADAAEKSRALDRAKAMFGNYGFSQYVRFLISKDMRNNVK